MKLNIFIITLSIVLLFSITNFCWAGKYGGEFLENGIGAKALAMGGCFVSIANDGSAPYWNPGGIGGKPTGSITAMHAFLFENLANHDYVSAMLPLPGDVSVALSWIRLGVDDIPEYGYLQGTIDKRIINPDFRPDGVPLSYFSDSESAYLFTFSRHSKLNTNLGWFYFGLPAEFGYGITIKYISHKLYDYVGTGTGLDAGVLLGFDLAELVEVQPLGWLSFGVNFQDVTKTKITWNTPSAREDEIPTNFKSGLSYRQVILPIRSEVTIGAETNSRYGYTRHFGFELQYNTKEVAKKAIDKERYHTKELYEKRNYDEYFLPDTQFALRAGLDDGDFTFGGGVTYRWLNLDYAFIKYELGNTHRISLQFDFKGVEPK